MLTGTDSSWHDSLISVARERRAGAEAAFYSDVEAGRLHRLAPGVAMPTSVWTTMMPEARMRARVRATRLRYPDEGPFSHLSAAALWELPLIDPLPAKVDVLAERATGGRSRRGITRHCVGLPAPVYEIDAMPVASIARTVVDSCTVASFAGGVAIADAALAARIPGSGVASIRATREEFAAEFDAATFVAGRVRCRRVLEFADPLSGSAGESLSRGGMELLGFPRPKLQVRFADAFGLIGIVDFLWEEYGLIGEFDGAGKYLREELRAGRDIAQVVMDEKRREDRLRALGFRVVRWGWHEARSLPLLERKLTQAGLPRRRAR